MSEDTKTREQEQEQEQEQVIRWRLYNLDDCDTIVSDHDDSTWVIGERRSVPIDYRTVSCCSYGFHCSRNIELARTCIAGSVVARVSVSGEHDIRDDKEAWEHMTILEAWFVPSYDGLNARFYDLIRSERWISYFSDEYLEQYDVLSFDRTAVENDDADTYQLQTLLNALYHCVPSDKRDEAYEEFVRMFVPCVSVEQEAISIDSRVNDILEPFVLLSLSSATRDLEFVRSLTNQLYKAYCASDRLVSDLLNDGTPVARGACSWSLKEVSND